MDNLPRLAWEPVTPWGVAAFSRAKVGRLLIFQLIVALVACASVLWLLNNGYFPTVSKALEKLPDKGEIRSGKLDWLGEPRQLLAENRLSAFNVDLEHSGQLRVPAHFQFEFGAETLRVYSSLNFFTDVPYSEGWIFAFNRSELVPKWGAWRLPILVLTAIAVMIWLMLTWTILATVYAVPVWLYGFYINRELTLRGSWKLAGAALMPGALVMAATFLLYDFGLFDLLTLTVIMGSHILLGWIYLGVSPLFLPRHPTEAGRKRNPFVSSKPDQAGH